MSVELNRDGAIKIIESIQKDFEERRIGMVGIYAEAFNTYIAALEMAKKSLEIDDKYDLAYEDAKAAGPWIDIHDKMPDYDLDFVLICFDNGFIDVATTDYVLDYEGSNKIVAWMPLPEPYKGAK